MLGSSYRVLTRSDFSTLSPHRPRAIFLSFSTTLTVLVAIALIVGAFIIFNAFSLVVAQRRRELALLRCLGTSRAQLALVVTGEAAAVGLAASVVGLVLGWLQPSSSGTWFRRQEPCSQRDRYSSTGRAHSSASLPGREWPWWPRSSRPSRPVGCLLS